MDNKNQQPPPPPPPKSFNEVSIEALEFCVEEISKHRTAIVALNVKTARVEEMINSTAKQVDRLASMIDALEVKFDDMIDKIRPLPPAA